MTKTTFEFPDYDPFKSIRETQERLAKMLKPLPVFDSMERIRRMFEPHPAFRQMERMNKLLEPSPVVRQMQETQARIASITQPFQLPHMAATARVFERTNQISSMLATLKTPLALQESYLKSLDRVTLRLAQSVAVVAAQSGRDLKDDENYAAVTTVIAKDEKGELSLSTSDRLAIVLAAIALFVQIYLSHGNDEQLARIHEELHRTNVAITESRTADQALADDQAERDAQLQQEVERLRAEVEELTDAIEAEQADERVLPTTGEEDAEGDGGVAR